MLPATVDTAAELSSERQGESPTPRQSHCHVGCLASSAADIIGRLAGWTTTAVIRGGCGSASSKHTNLCEPHTCTCGVPVDACGTHRLACKRSAGRRPATACSTPLSCDGRCCVPRSRPAKEPAGTQADQTGSVPDGVSLIPWSQGRCVDLERHRSFDTLGPIPSPVIGNTGRVSGCSSRSC